MRLTKRRAITGLFGALGIAATGTSQAGNAKFDFNSDPSGTIEIKGNNDAPWVSTGGNPASGGFLALTYSENSQFAAFQFPDIDQGKIVTAFTFKADLRVGNPNGNSGRPADGFSVSFARSNDPLNTDLGATGNFAGGIPEGGSTTGLAVSFDTWSGNTLPDGPDIEGIIVRVDNVTVNRTAMTTRNGACDDATSLQTGPYNQAYYDGGGLPRDPGAWEQLCWQPLQLDVTADSKVTVSWKGRKILDGFQTAFFPSAGSIILAGRTGGANENTHFDNVELITTASAADTVPPSAPGAVTATESGARHVKLAWGAATDNSGRVAYRVERDGVAIPGVLTDTAFTDFAVEPSKAYKYEVYAQDVSENKSAKVSVNVTTVAEVDNAGFLNAQQYSTDSSGNNFNGAGQADMDTVLGDPKYPNSPDRTYYVNGLQFGEPNFGDTYGENHLVRIAGVLTAPKTGSFRFYVRSDDSSRFFINKSGAAIPNASTDTPVAQENGCCGGFEAPGAADNGDGTFPTSEPISLTAGQRYGVLFLVKEGGGGDWGQVGWKEEGSSDPVSVVTGPVLSGGKGDPVGAAITFSQDPASTTVIANQSVTLSAAATVTSPYTKAPYYQWFKDGVIIPGATGNSLTIPIAAAANAGKYALEVGTIGLAKKSAEATLTVSADTKAPVISKVEGRGGAVSVTFDEPVKANTGTFTLSGGVTVTSASQAGLYTVALKTSDLASETAYTVTANGVQDNAGNSVAAGSTASFTSWKFVPNVVRVQYFDNLNPSTLANLQAVRQTTKATVDYTTNLFGAFTDRAENFGTILSAVIKPPSTGDYVFYISADDNAQLWLSTDENPANAKLVAIEPTWNGSRDWIGTDRRNASNPENRTDTYTGTQWATGNKITLQANSRYYLEMIAQEGGGGDNSGVAWKLASAADPASGDSPITGASIFGSYYPPTVVEKPTLSIARDGANVKVTYTGTLQGADVVTGPYSDVAGASSPYTVPTTGGSKYLRSRN